MISKNTLPKVNIPHQLKASPAAINASLA